MIFNMSQGVPFECPTYPKAKLGAVIVTVGPFATTVVCHDAATNVPVVTERRMHASTVVALILGALLGVAIVL